MGDRRSLLFLGLSCAPDAATTGVLVATATTMPVAQGASADASPKRGSQGWSSSSDDDGNYQGTSFGSRAALSHSHHRMTGCRRPRQVACHQASSRLQLPMQIAVWLGFAQWIVRCDSVSMTPLPPIARTTVIGWMLGASNSPARQAVTPRSFLTLVQIGNRLPNSWLCRLVDLQDLLFVQISAIGVRLTSYRFSSGILDLHEDLTRARWLRTSMARGM